GVADRPRLAGPGPDDVRVRWGDGHRANRLDGHLVEDGDERVAVVGGLPHAARRGAEVPGAHVARDAGTGRDAAAARRAHHLELERGRRLASARPSTTAPTRRLR